MDRALSIAGSVACKLMVCMGDGSVGIVGDIQCLDGRMRMKDIDLEGAIFNDNTGSPQEVDPKRVGAVEGWLYGRTARRHFCLPTQLLRSKARHRI